MDKRVEREGRETLLPLGQEQAEGICILLLKLQFSHQHKAGQQCRA